MRRPMLLAILTLTLLPPLAHADSFFTLSAAFANGDSATGTLDLDATTGLILGGTATVFTGSGALLQNTAIAPGPASHGIQRSRGTFDALLVYEDSGSPFASTFLQFDLPTLTLVGYTGSPIVVAPTFSNLILPGMLPSPLTSGSFTPTSATPEPQTFLLLATGLLAITATLPRRRRSL